MSTNKIALTSSMRSNLLTLQNTQKLFDKTQDKLSSGYKVNSAMDNPSSYFTAQSLNSRADDLSSLLDSIGQAISTLEVADQGITSLQDLVSQAKSVANSARDTTNVSASVKSKIKFDTDALRSELVMNTVTGLTANTSSMTVRTGKSTEVSGTTNVNNEMPVSSLGLTGASAGTIKVGDTTFNIDASGTTQQMASDVYAFKGGSTNKLTVSDYDATAKTATFTDADGNVFRNIDVSQNGSGQQFDGLGGTTKSIYATSDFTITQVIGEDGRTTGVITGGGTFTVSTSAAGSDLTAGEASSKTMTYASAQMEITSVGTNTLTLKDADNNEFVIAQSLVGAGSTAGYVVGNGVSLSAGAKLIVGEDGKTVVGAIGTLTDTDSAAAVSGNGTVSEQANTISINNAGTVEDMAKTIQSMIGNDKIKVGIEDGNLSIKTVDTSSVEVTGTFASAFGLDTGTTIKIAADDTAESLRQKIAGIDGVTAEFDAEGHMVVKSEQGDDMVISGELADKLGISGAATNGNNERAAYAKQFNDVMDQIDQLVQDTSYKGINLLNGDDLTVNFNENRTSSMELKGVTFNSSGLGFTRVADEWKSVEDIDKALDQVTKATSMLRAQASEFGQSLSTVQIREDFTTNMIKNLTTGADKLTLADTNEEAANLLALQTRQSLATTSLSLANQSAQGVLKLF